jgi:hypothetical protein
VEKQNAQARRWLISTCMMILVALAAALYPLASPVLPALAQSNYVIHVSVDGLGSSYLQALMNAGRARSFARLFREGASTLNARTDYDVTLTLPNHTSQLTGRPVNDKYGDSASGHHWITNVTPEQGVTLHANRGFYNGGAFDVAHDHGLNTALYASKDKFVLFENSWNAINGAQDTIGADDGRDKIDTYLNASLNATAMFSAFKAHMQSNPARYTFIHFDSPDTAGHYFGWGSAQYTNAVVLVDEFIGQLLAIINTKPALKNNTHIVLTADHGGIGNDHSDSTLAINYTVPFMVWGPGIQAGADLYAMNGSNTIDPGTSRIDYSLTSPQPIRNGDAGNCALRLLGLPAIPGSSLDHLRSVCWWRPSMPPLADLPFKSFMPFMSR